MTFVAFLNYYSACCMQMIIMMIPVSFLVEKVLNYLIAVLTLSACLTSNKLSFNVH